MLFVRFKKLVARVLALENTQADSGFVDYNDLATATTPIDADAGVLTALTNDTLGAFTNEGFLPAGVTSLWDANTNQFDWSELKLGDQVMIRADIELTTGTANTDVSVGLTLAIGGSAYTLYWVNDKPFKTAQNHGSQIVEMHVYIGDTNTLNNPAELVVNCEKDSTVKVNGWYIRVN